MKVQITCPACSFNVRGNAPDGTRRVKCRKCTASIELPAPLASVDENVDIKRTKDDVQGTVAPLKPKPPEPPMVLAAPDEPEPPPMVLAAPETEDDWELLQPRAFGLFARSITGGLSYNLCDPSNDDEVIGRVREDVTAGKALAGFLVGRQVMQGSIVVTDDATRDPVLLIERTNFNNSLLGATPCKVKLRDHRDEVIASFKVGKPTFAGMALDFDADCVVFDGNKEEWAIAEGAKYKDPDYAFVDGDGNMLARVRGKGETQGFMAASRSWTGKGGWLKITIDKEFKASPTQKLIILGTVIAIEFIITTLHETKPGTIRLS